MLSGEQVNFLKSSLSCQTLFHFVRAALIQVFVLVIKYSLLVWSLFIFLKSDLNSHGSQRCLTFSLSQDSVFQLYNNHILSWNFFLWAHSITLSQHSPGNTHRDHSSPCSPWIPSFQYPSLRVPDASAVLNSGLSKKTLHYLDVISLYYNTEQASGSLQEAKTNMDLISYICILIFSAVSGLKSYFFLAL